MGASRGAPMPRGCPPCARERAYRLSPPWTRLAPRSSISAPREQVFDYLQDIANHPEFTDHYLVDWHLTRIDSVGLGAGARFRVKAPAQPLTAGRT